MQKISKKAKNYAIKQYLRFPFALEYVLIKQE